MSPQIIKRIQTSFSTRVFVYLSFVLLLLSAVFTTHYIKIQSQQLKKELLKDGRIVTNIAANNVKLGIFSGETRFVQEALRSTINVPDVISTAVFDGDGILIANTSMPGLELQKRVAEKYMRGDFVQRMRIESSPVSIENDGTFVFWSRVLAGPEMYTEEMIYFDDAEHPDGSQLNVIGFVAVAYDKTPIIKSIGKILVQSILIFVVFMFLGCFATYFVVKAQTRPLQNLVASIRAKRVEEESMEDLDVLTDTFSGMVTSLESAFDRSRELQRGLEEKVEELKSEVHKRLQVEIELRESEDKFRIISESIAEGVAVVQNSTIIWCNPALYSIFGYEEDELLGSDANAVLPQVEHMQDYLRGNEVSSRYLIETTTKDNKDLLLEVYARKVDFEKQIALQIIVRDITKLDREEKKRKELEVKALGQSKLASMGKIAASVAHEVNQPLSFIKISFETIVRDLENQQVDPQETIAYCTESLRQVNRITMITQHLRSFGRIDPTVFTDTFLPDVLRNSLTLMGENLRLANIEITTEIADDLPPVLANTVQLEQVFINLFQNSHDAMIDSDNKQIYISMHKTDQKVLIFFADSGPGIADEELDSIFEPFFTTKRLEDRSGLGLGIINNIINEHNGTIEYQQRKGWGAGFLIVLPEALPHKKRGK